jgi:hypothetical protein
MPVQSRLGKMDHEESHSALLAPSLTTQTAPVVWSFGAPRRGRGEKPSKQTTHAKRLVQEAKVT